MSRRAPSRDGWNRHGIERESQYKDESWLSEQYVGRSRHQHDIADDCGVTKATISHWLSRHGITDGASYERTQCDNCGDHFRHAPSLCDALYCSNACANDQRKRQVTVECVGCGETFERRASLDTEYCSVGCWGRIQHLHQTGQSSIAASGTDSVGERCDATTTDALFVVFPTKSTPSASVEA